MTNIQTHAFNPAVGAQEPIFSTHHTTTNYISNTALLTRHDASELRCTQLRREEALRDDLSKRGATICLLFQSSLIFLQKSWSVRLGGVYNSQNFDQLNLKGVWKKMTHVYSSLNILEFFLLNVFKKSLYAFFLNKKVIASTVCDQVFLCIGYLVR